MNSINFPSVSDDRTSNTDNTNNKNYVAQTKSTNSNLIKLKELYLAGGSFWGLQKYFDLIFGVLQTEVGYVNGRTSRTKYEKCI